MVYTVIKQQHMEMNVHGLYTVIKQQHVEMNVQG